MKLEQRGQSIQWLADELGVNRTITLRYSQGTRLPPVDVQEKIFQKLELPYKTIDDIVKVK